MEAGYANHVLYTTALQIVRTLNCRGRVRIVLGKHPVISLYPTIKYTRKCTALWGEPDRVHMQNMEQLHALDSHQNVAEPQATENHIKYTYKYTGTVNQAWL